MYAFELAAEFKARSERNLVLVTTASVRSIYHISVTSYKILYDVIVKTFQEKNPNAVNRRYRRNNRGADLVENAEDYSNFDEDSPPPSAATKRSASVVAQSRRNQQQQTTTETVAGIDADEQTLNDFLAFLAQRKAADATANTTQPQPQAQSSNLKPSQIPQPPYLPGFQGPDGQIIPLATRVAPAAVAPKPVVQRPAAPAPQQSRPAGLDFSELTRRPLRKVGGDGDNGGAATAATAAPAPIAKSEGIDLSELKLRPLRKVVRDENGIVQGSQGAGAPGAENQAPLFPRNLKPVQTNANKQEPPKEQLVILGRRVESSSIPGEESMSFSDRIKVASKMSLKQTREPRSPGGTPRRERKQQESEFVVALRHKFRNVNRESINEQPDGADSETDWS